MAAPLKVFRTTEVASRKPRQDVNPGELKVSGLCLADHSLGLAHTRCSVEVQ
jgi:hypothetical protein